MAFGLAAACAALAQEAIPYSLDCHRLILVDESHYFETIDIFDDYDIDFDVIETFERRTNMFTKELYKITCTRNGETSDIGTYLLKPGPEAPMDCYRNFLNKTDVAVSIKSVPEGFIITDNSEPDTSYHLMFIPMDDDFWARCAAEKETKQ